MGRRDTEKVLNATIRRDPGINWSEYNGGSQCTLPTPDYMSSGLSNVHSRIPVLDVGTPMERRIQIIADVLKNIVRTPAKRIVFAVVEKYPDAPHQVVIFWSGTRLYWYDSNGLYVGWYITSAFIYGLQRELRVPVEVMAQKKNMPRTGIQNIYKIGSCVVHSCWAAEIMSESVDIEETWRNLHDKTWLKTNANSVIEHAHRLSAKMDSSMR